MIKFNNISKEKPYTIFQDIYHDSFKAKQKNIEAISISSYSPKTNEVTARFVNLKFINDKEFIFFSNYESPKSKDFSIHNQITGLIYWNSVNVQIRLKAKIKKTSKEFNNTYFAERDKNKNAIAISSNQSTSIDTFHDVINNYEESKKKDNLTICPDYWGGFSFTPYYFEFWKGQQYRLNKRDAYSLKDNEWIHQTLQP